jgi:hypothetical protein
MTPYRPIGAVEPIGVPLRHMGMRLACALLAVVALTACSGGGPRPQAEPTTLLTAQQRADRTCREKVPKNFVNAEPTTAGTIHALSGGPARNGGQLHGYTWILRDVPPQDFAAWCWYRVKPHTFKLLVVGPNGQVIDSGQEYGGGRPPGAGPMAVT